MIIAGMLLAVGIICVAVGILFLRKHYTTYTPNEELEWLGYGEHPFRKQ